MELVAPIVTLVTSLIPLIAQAASARAESSAAILVAFNEAVAACNAALNALPTSIAADNAAIDAELAEGTATPIEPKLVVSDPKAE